MIFAPVTQPDRFALSKAADRGRLRRITPGLYTDDLTTPLESLVSENLPALIAAGYPDAYLSHSTAALLRPLNGSAYISSPATTTRPIKLPGTTVHRPRPLPFPEVVSIDLEEMVARSLSSEPNPLKARVSSPLQTVFDLLTPDRRQPDRSLPPETIRELVDALSQSDRLRAKAFADRNGLQTEMSRLDEILKNLRKTRGFQVTPPEALELFFYRWRVGQIETLPNREYRFTYDDNWNIPLSGLPQRQEGPSYEGPGLPAFLDNMLPEGWAEARLQAAFEIARGDTFALLRTTQKYLSNITLRPHNFDESRLALDFLSARLSDISNAIDPLPVLDDISADPDSRELWIELRKRGAQPNAAGIDVGSAFHFVAVPPDRDDEPVREFPSFTVDLNALADWLFACGVDTVAMESTGVYWIPLFERLESRGFTVLHVNARHVKNVSGRKSDVLDCQWLQQLMTYGLLSGAFRPTDAVCALRSLWRLRGMLLRSQGRHVQPM